MFIVSFDEHLAYSIAFARSARAQRDLYHKKTTKAQQDALSNVPHVDREYTFVADYGQNMEMPAFNKSQPGETYYYSPLSVSNFGFVDVAHINDEGKPEEHCHAHVYHSGEGKKGADNVASLILKTLKKLNLLRENEAGGVLNIIFDNCTGQNKNNTGRLHCLSTLLPILISCLFDYVFSS